MHLFFALMLACGASEPSKPDAAATAPAAAPEHENADVVKTDGGRAGELDVATLKQRVDAGGTFVLDVRTPQEFAEGHVPGATNIPVQELEARIAELDAYKDQDIDVICRSGSRSSSATKTLRGSGFARASNVRGGTMAWIDAGYAVEQ